MNQQQQPRTLPSFSGLSSAVNEARDYEKSRSSGAGQLDLVNPSGNSASRRRHGSPTSETAATESASANVPSKTDASGNILVQDTLSPLLDEVDALFERSKEIIADLVAQGKEDNEDVRESGWRYKHTTTYICRLHAKHVLLFCRQWKFTAGRAAGQAWVRLLYPSPVRRASYFPLSDIVLFVLIWCFFSLMNQPVSTSFI